MITFIKISRRRTKELLRIGFCHHKCGTRFLRPVFQALCKVIGFQYVQRDWRSPLSEEEQQAFRSRAFVFYMNSVYGKLVTERGLRNYRAYHIVRDPRDMIVSGYFSHLYSHEIDGEWHQWLIPIRERLTKLSLEEGLLFEIEQGYALKDIASWNFRNPRILEIKAEDLFMRGLEKSLAVTLQLLKHLEIDGIPGERLKSILRNGHAFWRGDRKLGEEDVRSHFRKGTPGDWRKYFTKKHAERFKEKWGNLLIQLGYEKDNRWGA